MSNIRDYDFLLRPVDTVINNRYLQESGVIEKIGPMSKSMAGRINKNLHSRFMGELLFLSRKELLGLHNVGNKVLQILDAVFEDKGFKLAEFEYEELPEPDDSLSYAESMAFYKERLEKFVEDLKVKQNAATAARIDNAGPIQTLHLEVGMNVFDTASIKPEFLQQAAGDAAFQEAVKKLLLGFAHAAQAQSSVAVHQPDDEPDPTGSATG